METVGGEPDKLSFNFWKRHVCLVACGDIPTCLILRVPIVGPMRFLTWRRQSLSLLRYQSGASLGSQYAELCRRPKKFVPQGPCTYIVCNDSEVVKGFACNYSWAQVYTIQLHLGSHLGYTNCGGFRSACMS